MRESTIENAVCSYAKSRGWLVYKFKSPQQAGVPDRLFIKAGKVVFVEFKAPNEQPRRLQKFVITEMEAHGATVHIIDNKEAGYALF